MFLSSLFSLQILPSSPPCYLSNSWPFLKLLLFTFLNITCSVFITLFVFMFPKLTIGIGKPIGMIFPEDNYFSYCQQFLTAVVLSFHVLAVENREIMNIEK